MKMILRVNLSVTEKEYDLIQKWRSASPRNKIATKLSDIFMEYLKGVMDEENNNNK